MGVEVVRATAPTPPVQSVTITNVWGDKHFTFGEYGDDKISVTAVVDGENHASAIPSFLAQHGWALVSKKDAAKFGRALIELAEGS